MDCLPMDQRKICEQSSFDKQINWLGNVKIFLNSTLTSRNTTFSYTEGWNKKEGYREKEKYT